MVDIAGHINVLMRATGALPKPHGQKNGMGHEFDKFERELKLVNPLDLINLPRTLSGVPSNNQELL